MFRTVATAVITAILTSAFWIFAYNTGAIPTAAERRMQPAGDIAVVDPKAGPPVAVAEGLEVGPAELVGPVGQLAMLFGADEAAQQIFARLADPGPVPGIAGRHLLLSHIEIFEPASGLALRSVGDDFEAIVAIDHRNILEDVARGAVRSAKC